jgi:hypothetical protein
MRTAYSATLYVTALNLSCNYHLYKGDLSLFLQLRRVGEEQLGTHIFRISRSLSSISNICHLSNLLYILLRELDIQGAEILLQRLQTTSTSAHPV